MTKVSTYEGWILFLAMVLVASVNAEERPQAAFELPATNGESLEIAPNGDVRLTVVCFLGTECPLAKLYAGRLADLAGEYKSKGVRFVAVSSNKQDSLEDVRRFTVDYRLGFPFLKDYRNTIADQFDAKRTPEVFVLDADFIVRYRGRIDDQYDPGIVRPKVGREDLKIAIDELLAKQPVTHPYREPAGCIIGRVREPVESSEVTWCKQVSRILQAHCVECHRQGEIGPFVLDDYEEATGWGDMMLEVIADQRMPPWHANPDHGEFANERHFPDADRKTLQEWVDSGMPYGNPTELPPPATYTNGWRLPREPDLVVEMNEGAFEVPATGTVEYQYFVVDPGFEEDKWVTAAQVLPGNHRVVHHSIVFIRPPDGSKKFRGVGWLAAYVPGQTNAPAPAGAAVRVPAGSRFVFQQHYTPTGTEQSDKTRIAMTFADPSEITHEIYSIIGIDQDIEIRPYANSVKVTDNVRYFPSNADLLAIMPHMHLRGKSFRMTAKAGGESTILLDVPNYDFNWQHSYQLKEPLPLSNVDDLTFEVTFDNSDANPFNPDPSQFVTWGDQTWEEMAVVFLAISVPLNPDKSIRRPAARTTESHATGDPEKAAPSPQLAARIKAEADRIIDRFDLNGDGEVTEYETPIAFRRFSFRDIDKDRDGRLTRKEIKRAARKRLRE